MKLIFGLGNPEEKFQSTRHNIGFMVIEKLAKVLLPIERSEKAWKGEKRFSAYTCKVDRNLILVKPHTYMNRSGIAVLALVNFYKVLPFDVWVVHDDIDLPLGKIRIRKGGGSAGHNGIESIIKTLNFSEFVRFRLGIGKGKLNLFKTAGHNLHRREIEKFVLSPFRDNEAGEVKKMIKKTVKALKTAINEDLEKAMNMLK